MNVERLRELLSYDPETGVFSHQKKRTGVPYAGMKAGYVNESRGIPYERIKVDGKAYKTHRLAWLYVHGKFPDGEIDHINGNTLDNRICNLRDVTRQDNCKNRTKRSDNKSGVNGVVWYPPSQKWQASIAHDKKTIHLGYFSDIECAKKARKEAEAKYGYHSNHGRLKAEALPPNGK